MRARACSIKYVQVHVHVRTSNCTRIQHWSVVCSVVSVVLLPSKMDRWDTFVKTTTSETGASRVVVDLDGTLGAAAFDGSCVSTDVSASVSGSSSLSPKDHDYELIIDSESDLSEEVSKPMYKLYTVCALFGICGAKSTSTLLIT